MRFLGLLLAVTFLTTACGSGQKGSDKSQNGDEGEKMAADSANKQSESDQKEIELRFPEVSPKGSVAQVVGVNQITVDYYRPSVSDPETGKKRKIWGSLVPYGERWRTGANGRTTIAFSHDVSIQGESLKAGEYALFTIPGKEQWTIIFNKETTGSPLSDYDKSKDALRVKAEPKKAPYHEMMTFAFSNVTDSTANIELAWKRTRVPFNISTETGKQVMAMMRKAVDKAGKDDWEIYSRCAGYLAGKGKSLDKAQEWIDQSIAVKKHWRNTWTKAEVMKATGNMEKAVSLAKEALEMGEKAGMSSGYKNYIKDELEKMQEKAQT